MTNLKRAAQFTFRGIGFEAEWRSFGAGLRPVSRHTQRIEASIQLKDVRYEIRGKLARRALEMERQGYKIAYLNIGNPG